MNQIHAQMYFLLLSLHAHAVSFKLNIHALKMSKTLETIASLKYN